MNTNGRDEKGTEAQPRSRHASESSLLSQLRKRDPDAFEQISDQYRARLHCLALKILKNVQDAEDAVQETLFLCFVKIDTFGARSSLYTWLTRILVNCCFMQLRKRGKSAIFSLDETGTFDKVPWSDTLASDAPAVDETLVLDEQVTALRKVVGGLRQDLNFILTAQYQDDLPLADIASQLGLSVSATKSRALRARNLCARNIRLHMPRVRSNVAMRTTGLML